MSPIEWLEQLVPGFAQLGAEERAAIQDFALLWSLFESRALNSDASVKQIVSAVQECERRGRLDLDRYTGCLKYFKSRYFRNGDFTYHYTRLRLRHRDNEKLVQSVLRGENNTPADCVSVILVIVYRFRSNLFHGSKWEYELQGQLTNFTHANEALMVAYDQIIG